MDLKEQKAETEEVFAEIAKHEAMPAAACINFQFVVDGKNPDWDAFTEAAEAAGYTVEWYDADEEDEACLEITTAEEPLSLENLWAHEERLSLMGAIHGFAADGWGFFTE